MTLKKQAPQNDNLHASTSKNFTSQLFSRARAACYANSLPIYLFISSNL